ncbi:MAG: hydroxymethylglutaryl-CoA lyase [Chitinophagales bacterium]|nr:hydroxymethylglutaryl-CoA lyase [Chitinophagales bacterium]
MVQIIECPRDAMQGIHQFIPTADKVRYINALLKVGFHTLDCGSFVSPRYIPQMQDTAKVLNEIDLTGSHSKLSVIVANVRGAEEACQHENVTYLGFPFSISETFQLRNTNATIEQSLHTVEAIKATCEKAGKQLVVYLSMAFGNPYDDPWDIDVAGKWIDRLSEMDIRYVSLSDTIGVATPEVITYFFRDLTRHFPQMDFGAHFHTTPETWREKVEPAYKNGCNRFDGAIKGFGGCPMAKDDLVGNMPTERLVEYFEEQGVATGLNREAFFEAMQIALEVFPH